MTFPVSLATVAAAGILATASLAQQPSPNPQQTPSKATVVSLIGCVERVPATPPVAGNAQPTPQRAVYKLIDVQPGAGTTLPMKADSQFLLSVSTSLTTPLDLGKFQNQRVEATGTISAVPPETVKPPATTRPGSQVQTASLPTFTTTAVKVISTECK